MQMDRDLRENLFRQQINDGDRTFAGDVADRIDLYPCATASWSRQISRAGTSPTPVADVSLVSGEHHVIGRHTDIKEAQQLSGRWVEFTKPIRQVQCHVKFFSVR